MNIFRTEFWKGVYAIFAVLFQLSMLSNTGAGAMPDAEASLMADLAVICTIEGRTGDTGQPTHSNAACEHCTGCTMAQIPVSGIGVVAMVPVIMDRMHAVRVNAFLAEARAFERPHGRAPPPLPV